MTYQIIIQPDDKLSLYDKEEHKFLIMSANEDEVYTYLSKQAEKRFKERLIRLRNDVSNTVERLKKGEKVFYQFTMSFGGALEDIEKFRGKEARDKAWLNVDKLKKVV